jgi:hypothetical protein
LRKRYFSGKFEMFGGRVDGDGGGADMLGGTTRAGGPIGVLDVVARDKVAMSTLSVVIAKYAWRVLSVEVSPMSLRRSGYGDTGHVKASGR